MVPFQEALCLCENTNMRKKNIYCISGPGLRIGKKRMWLFTKQCFVHIKFLAFILSDFSQPTPFLLPQGKPWVSHAINTQSSRSFWNEGQRYHILAWWTLSCPLYDIILQFPCIEYLDVFYRFWKNEKREKDASPQNFINAELSFIYIGCRSLMDHVWF